MSVGSDIFGNSGLLYQGKGSHNKPLMYTGIWEGGREGSTFVCGEGGREKCMVCVWRGRRGEVYGVCVEREEGRSVWCVWRGRRGEVYGVCVWRGRRGEVYGVMCRFWGGGGIEWGVSWSVLGSFSVYIDQIIWI